MVARDPNGIRPVEHFYHNGITAAIDVLAKTARSVMAACD